MPVFMVQVGVCLERPVKTDAFMDFAVEAPDHNEASLIAHQMACVKDEVVMSTDTVFLDWVE